MPIHYKPPVPVGGATLDGDAVPGALVVAKEGGKLGAFTVGAAGQLLSVDDAGALTWITMAPGTGEAIPIATAALVGLVRSSGTTDTIAVDGETGVMSLNAVSVAKLRTPVGDEWILHAGTAQRR